MGWNSSTRSKRQGGHTYSSGGVPFKAPSTHDGCRPQAQTLQTMTVALPTTLGSLSVAPQMHFISVGLSGSLCRGGIGGGVGAGGGIGGGAGAALDPAGRLTPFRAAVEDAAVQGRGESDGLGDGTCSLGLLEGIALTAPPSSPSSSSTRTSMLPDDSWVDSTEDLDGACLSSAAAGEPFADDKTTSFDPASMAPPVPAPAPPPGRRQAKRARAFAMSSRQLSFM
mmetsp:Transcript_18043/g.46811  ORF Transcript_18043/g.46811 Transcript_18043/m.46811 type:complete len:225 (-) Transcript_18043:293-967(-)